MAPTLKQIPLTRGSRTTLAFTLALPLCLVVNPPGPSTVAPRSQTPPPGWTTHSPRKELRPAFEYEASGGWRNSPRWAIGTDAREGLIGWWETVVPVEGGRTYRFEVRRRCEGAASPRQSCYARVFWQDEKGGAILRDKPVFATYMPGAVPQALPDYPPDRDLGDGWTLVADTYAAPKAARRAVV